MFVDDFVPILQKLKTCPEHSINRNCNSQQKITRYEPEIRIRVIKVYFFPICTTAVNCGKRRPRYVRLKARAGHSAECHWRGGCKMIDVRHLGPNRGERESGHYKELTRIIISDPKEW